MNGFPEISWNHVTEPHWAEQPSVTGDSGQGHKLNQYIGHWDTGGHWVSVGLYPML